jgi:hypothetical protein
MKLCPMVRRNWVDARRVEDLEGGIVELVDLLM